MSIFAYLRDGDRTDANKIRVMANSPLLLVKLGAETPVVLPEGKTVSEYRAELEATGIEFRFRLISFLDWMKDNASELVEKWKGWHKDSIYPVSPEGTFWNEYNPEGAEQEWTIDLLSDETGEPVAGFEDYVAEVKTAILEKNLTEDGKINVPSRFAKPEAPAEAPVDAPVASEGTDTAPSAPEASEAAPSEAGEATGEGSGEATA